MGAEAGSIGILTTYLAEVRGFSSGAAKLGLVVFLIAVAAGRLIVGYAVKPKQILSSALGTVKIAIPLGGIVPPLIMSLIASKISLQASLAVFPVSFLLGFLLVLALVTTTHKQVEAS